MLLRPEAYFFNLYAIPNIIVSTLILAVGLFVFCQNRRSPSNIFFFLFCLSLNLWLYGRAIMYCSRDPETALLWAKFFAKLGVVHIAPLVYTFSVHWLGLYRAQKKYVILGFWIAAIFYITILTTPYGVEAVRRYFWGYYPVYGPICKLFLLFFFTYFIAAFRNFFVEWKKLKDPVRGKQIKIVTIAYLISFTGSIDYLPKIVNLPFYPFGYLSVLVWTLVLAYAIVRYRVMDIQTVIHKTLMWFATTVVAILPFAGLVYVTFPWYRELPPLAGTVYLVLLLIGFYFYFRIIQPRLDDFFRRRRANLQFVLSRFSSELVHLKNLRDLLQGVARLLRRTLYVGKVSIYLKDPAGEQLLPCIAKRVRGPKSLALDHPFLKWIEKRDAVVLADLIQSNPEVEPFKEALLDYFSKVEALVAMPLVLGGSLIGMIHLGKKDNLRKFAPDEIQFLVQLKSPVTIAFSNSLQFIAMQENLSKWNEELEKKVDERTRQLQDTQAQLVQAEKLATIGTLAGGVAHEINNPLTAVLTNAQILKVGAKSEDVESLSLIEEGARRCQTIIQKMMKYARKPLGPEVTEKVDLNKVVANTIAFLGYQLKQENISLKVEEFPGPLTPVEGNSNELEQVLTNLILNAKDAVKAAKHEGLIHIQTFEKNGNVGLSVADNGIGIPAENLPKIFDPFFTTKDIGKGTGLGLAVSYGIVEKHKGRIDVQSEVGKGTAFTVTLPRGAT